MSRVAALLRVLVCAMGLGAQMLQPAVARVGAPHAVTDAAFRAPLVEEKDGCGQGAATRKFGWKVFDYGVATLKFLVGLFLIPIGLLLVCIGYVLEVAEAIAC